MQSIQQTQIYQENVEEICKTLSSKGNNGIDWMKNFGLGI